MELKITYAGNNVETSSSTFYNKQINYIILNPITNKKTAEINFKIIPAAKLFCAKFVPRLKLKYYFKQFILKGILEKLKIEISKM